MDAASYYPFGLYALTLVCNGRSGNVDQPLCLAGISCETKWLLKLVLLQYASACLQYMITGSSLIKVRPNSRQYHRFFTLSEDMNTLKWTPTNKKTAKAVLCLRKEAMSVVNDSDDIFILFSLINESLEDNWCVLAAKVQESNLGPLGLKPGALTPTPRDRVFKGLYALKILCYAESTVELLAKNRSWMCKPFPGRIDFPPECPGSRLGLEGGHREATHPSGVCPDGILVRFILRINSHTDELVRINSHNDELAKINSHNDELARINSHNDELERINSHTDELEMINSHNDELARINSHNDELARINSHNDELERINSHTDDLVRINSHTDELVRINSHNYELDKINSHTDELARINSHTDELVAS
uniref:Uncharacterized protein n=1 Tax=Timema shepardi TaxID=629360 RepID=A0A7R9FZS4_TIMSH|nr:unnamed protein product [Timema shepardi]